MPICVFMKLLELFKLHTILKNAIFWEEQVSLKCQFITNTRSATSQKTALFIVTTVKTPNPPYNFTLDFFIL
jgi:hypothetical protein